MLWLDELQDGCPPNVAVPPDNNEFYRLVSSEEPQSEDFMSSDIFPYKTVLGAPSGVSECITHSVSLFSDHTTCRNIRKLPAHRNKVMAKVTLSEDSGLIHETCFTNHFSWWRNRDFDIIAVCNIVYI